MPINDYICVICDKVHEYYDDEVNIDNNNNVDCEVYIAPKCDCGANKVIKKKAQAHVFGAFKSYSYHISRPDSITTKQKTYRETCKRESDQWARKELDKSESKGN